MSDATPLIAAREVRKTYVLERARIEVLRGVSLAVSRGETLCIMGASGAGKSTLLHLLGGLDVPTAGEVQFDGRPLHRMGAAERAGVRARRIGFVFQSYYLLPEMDIVDNVALPAMSRPGAARRDRENRARALDLLRQVGLEARAMHRPAELSGGEMQRVALARALMNGPEVLLADEPTGNLDSATGGQVLDLLFAQVAERGLTLVLVTHNDQVAARCGRTLRLVDGRLDAPA
jgi:predicted ABC-type transport system involved in lysophospholipase L1 biosynthesis ATPase subunit